MYYVTNVFVRVLGYDVRPFPGGWVARRNRKAARRLLQLGLRGARTRRRLAARRSTAPFPMGRSAVPLPAHEEGPGEWTLTHPEETRV
jgi:hypothetical protein